MMRSGLWSICFVPALTALLFADMDRSLAAGAEQNVRNTIIAASGTAAPVGGNYSPFFINVSLNARHEVAFDAFVIGPSPTTGVFVGDGKTTSTIALGVNPDPAAPSFGFVSVPFITPNGVVVFDVNETDIFRSDGQKIVPLVRDGDPAPGGGTVSPRLGTRAVNNHGVIAYLAGVNGSTATQAIFRTDGTQTVAIARDDIAPPTGGRFTALFEPAMNNRGQVAFKAEMSGGTADNGIFRGEGGHLTPVFVTNQIVSDGAIIQDCGTPAINAYGQVVAQCLVMNSAISSGLFVGDGTTVISIALQGQTAPTGGIYSTFVGTTRLNDRGEVAFGALFEDGATGIFRRTGEQTTTIASTGMSAPGTTGMFQSFGDDIRFRNDGAVAFVGTLAIGVGGVDASNNLGIWIGTSAEDLRLVVRTGEVIGGKVLASLPFREFGGQQFDMNENSVVWVGGFQSGAKAVVLSRDDENDEADDRE